MKKILLPLSILGAAFAWGCGGDSKESAASEAAAGGASTSTSTTSGNGTGTTTAAGGAAAGTGGAAATPAGGAAAVGNGGAPGIVLPAPQTCQEASQQYQMLLNASRTCDTEATTNPCTEQVPQSLGCEFNTVVSADSESLSQLEDLQTYWTDNECTAQGGVQCQEPQGDLTTATCTAFGPQGGGTTGRCQVPRGG